MDTIFNDPNQQPVGGNNNEQFYREAIVAMIEGISKTEREICVRLLCGDDNTSICQRLGMMREGLNNHRSHIWQKAGIKDRNTELEAHLFELVEKYRKRRRKS